MGRPQSDVKESEMVSADTVEPVKPEKTTTKPAGPVQEPKTEPEVQQQAAGGQPVFKLQITASATKLNHNHASLKDLKDLDYYQEGGYYKYTVGAETDYNKINQIRLDLKKRFPDAFIIAFVGDKKVPVQEALKMIK